MSTKAQTDDNTRLSFRRGKQKKRIDLSKHGNNADNIPSLGNLCAEQRAELLGRPFSHQTTKKT